MPSVYLVSVWIHLLAVVAWLGGSLFLVWVLVPAVRNPELEESTGELIRLTVRRFFWVVWGSFAVLGITGGVLLYHHGWLTPYALEDSDFWESPVGTVLAWKLGLFGSILGLSVLHDFVLGPFSRAAGRHRRWKTWIARIKLLLGLVAAALGVALSRWWV
jgi:uncharacterized membrane protein